MLDLHAAKTLIGELVSIMIEQLAYMKKQDRRQRSLNKSMVQRNDSSVRSEKDFV